MKNPNEDNEDFKYCHDYDPYTYACLDYIGCEECPQYYADLEDNS